MQAAVTDRPMRSARTAELTEAIVTSLPPLPSPLQAVVPECAQPCIDTVAAQTFQCSSGASDAQCFCQQYNSEGFTLGEVALVCLQDQCTTYDDSESFLLYNICTGITGSVPAIHSTLTLPAVISITPGPSTRTIVSTTVPRSFTPSSSNSASATQSNLASASARSRGLTSAQAAGITLGVTGAVGIVVGILLFWILHRRRRSQADQNSRRTEEREDQRTFAPDKKSSTGGGASASSKHAGLQQPSRSLQTAPIVRPSAQPLHRLHTTCDLPKPIAKFHSPQTPLLPERPKPTYPSKKSLPRPAVRFQDEAMVSNTATGMNSLLRRLSSTWKPQQPQQPQIPQAPQKLRPILLASTAQTNNVQYRSRYDSLPKAVPRAVGLRSPGLTVNLNKWDAPSHPSSGRNAGLHTTGSNDVSSDRRTSKLDDFSLAGNQGFATASYRPSLYQSSTDRQPVPPTVPLPPLPVGVTEMPHPSEPIRRSSDQTTSTCAESIFELDGSDEVTPPHELDAPLEAPRRQIEDKLPPSPARDIRYPKIPRPSNQAVPRYTQFSMQSGEQHRKLIPSSSKAQLLTPSQPSAVPTHPPDSMRPVEQLRTTISPLHDKVKSPILSSQRSEHDLRHSSPRMQHRRSASGSAGLGMLVESAARATVSPMIPLVNERWAVNARGSTDVLKATPASPPSAAVSPLGKEHDFPIGLALTTAEK